MPIRIVYLARKEEGRVCLLEFLMEVGLLKGMRMAELVSSLYNMFLRRQDKQNPSV